MKLRPVVILLIVAIFLMPNLFAQSIKFSKKEQRELSYVIDSIIGELEIYSTFTEDDEQLSEYYIIKFKSLFEKNALIFNDLEKNNVRENLLSTKDYITTVKNLYPNGIGVKYYNIIKTFKGCKKQNANCYVKINLDKEIYGYSKYGKKRDTNNLTITFKYNKNSSDFNLKIISIYNEKQEIKSENDKKHWEFGLLINPAFNTISTNEYNNTKLRFNNGSFGLNYKIQLSNFYSRGESNQIGFGLGFGISNFKSNLTFDSITQPPLSMTDLDNDNLQLIAEFTDVTEEIRFSLIEISIYLLRLKNLSMIRNMELFIDLGFNISFPSSTSSNFYGKESFSGYYYTNYYEVLIDDVDYLAYYQDEEFKVSINPKFNSTLFSGFINIGISKYIGKSFLISLGLNLTKGFSNLVPAEDFFVVRQDHSNVNIYNSTLSMMTSSKNLSTGLILGLYYKF